MDIKWDSKEPQDIMFDTNKIFNDSVLYSSIVHKKPRKVDEIPYILEK